MMYIAEVFEELEEKPWLEPCPFCGASAQVEYASENSVRVSCMNLACRAAISPVGAFLPFNRWGLSEEHLWLNAAYKAIEKWNERWLPPPPNESEEKVDRTIFILKKVVQELARTSERAATVEEFIEELEELDKEEKWKTQERTGPGPTETKPSEP